MIGTFITADESDIGVFSQWIVESPLGESNKRSLVVPHVHCSTSQTIELRLDDFSPSKVAESCRMRLMLHQNDYTIRQ